MVIKVAMSVNETTCEISCEDGVTSVKISRELSRLLSETQGKFTLVLSPTDQAIVDGLQYRKSIKNLVSSIKAFGGTSAYKLATSSTSEVYLSLSTLHTCGRVITNFICAPGTALVDVVAEMKLDPHFAFVTHEQSHAGDYIVYKPAPK